MKRRKFLAAPGGAITAWPLAAYGQQATMPVIGVLSSASLADPPQLVTAFRQGRNHDGASFIAAAARFRER